VSSEPRKQNVLTIRNDQFRVLAQAPRRAFEDELIEFARRHYRRESTEIGPDQMREAARTAIVRAEAFGLATKRQVTTYFSMALLLGSSFDEDPQLPWARAALLDSASDGAGGDIGPRVRQAWLTTVAYVVRTAGAAGEHLVRALVRTRAFALGDAPRSSGAEQEAELSALLRTLHPTKWEHQGDDATREIVRAAQSAAEELDVNSPEGVLLLSGLGFLLGSGALDDPLFPWVRRDLAVAATGEERIARLHASALAYVDGALATR
jgi:hypothetical protein